MSYRGSTVGEMSLTNQHYTRPAAERQARSDLIEVVLQLAAARGMPQLAQRLGLDLADALARHLEFLADFFQRAGPPAVQAEAHLQHAALALAQRVQHLFDLFAQHLVRGHVLRRGGALVGQEVGQIAVVFFAHRHLQGDGFLGHLHDLAHPGGRQFQPQRQLVGGWLAAQFLYHAPRFAGQAVDDLHHVYRNANGARLVGDGAGDGLPDPPGCIGRELEAAPIVELLDGANEADVALLDQVQQVHAAADVLLGHANHQAQIGLGQALARVEAAGDDRLIEAPGPHDGGGFVRVDACDAGDVGDQVLVADPGLGAFGPDLLGLPLAQANDPDQIAYRGVTAGLDTLKAYDPVVTFDLGVIIEDGVLVDDEVDGTGVGLGFSVKERRHVIGGQVELELFASVLILFTLNGQALGDVDLADQPLERPVHHQRIESTAHGEGHDEIARGAFILRQQAQQVVDGDVERAMGQPQAGREIAQQAQDLVVVVAGQRGQIPDHAMELDFGQIKDLGTRPHRALH